MEMLPVPTELDSPDIGEDEPDAAMDALMSDETELLVAASPATPQERVTACMLHVVGTGNPTFLFLLQAAHSGRAPGNIFKWHHDLVADAETMFGKAFVKQMSINVRKTRLYTVYSGVGGAELAYKHLVIALTEAGCAPVTPPVVILACDNDPGCQEVLKQSHNPLHLVPSLECFVTQDPREFLVVPHGCTPRKVRPPKAAQCPGSWGPPQFHMTGGSRSA